jgi:hypothetical protein
MVERHFRFYVFPEDDDVVFVGLDRWIEHAGNPTPLLGTYLCDATEVNARFDELEADLKRCRRATLAAVERLGRKRIDIALKRKPANASGATTPA